MNKSKIKISILMKSEVKEINEHYTAGCERVFLQDTDLLISKRILSTSYVACKKIFVNKKLKPKIKRLLYPHQFVETIKEKHNKNRLNILKSLYSFVYNTTVQLADIFYSLQFLTKEKKADIYYVFEHSIVTLLFPKKTILSYHNFDKNHKSIIWLKILFFTMKLVKSKYKVNIVFVSESLKNQFTNQFTSYIEFINSTVVYNGTHISKIKHNDKKFYKTIRFIYPSVWMEKKGILLLPKVIKEINKSFLKRVEFVICGSVNLWSLPEYVYKDHARIEKEINNLAKMFSNVKINKKSYIEMSLEYKKATFTLFPSIWKEPFALSVIESLSKGTPVIAFNIGGTAEIISDTKNGYLIDKLNAESYIRQVKLVVSSFNEINYKKLSDNARSTSLLFSLKRRNKKLLNLLLKNEKHNQFKKN